MKKSIVSILFCLITFIAACAPNEELSELKFRDPVSGTELLLPRAQIIKYDSLAYQKAVIYTENTAVYIYSMPNQDDRPFSWKEVNKFDENNKFGTLARQEKLPDADGWLRFYESYDKKYNRKLYYAVSLVRGDSYALYVSECSYSTEDFVTPGIIKATVFPKTESRRVNNDGKLTVTFWIVIAVCLLIAAISKWFFGKEPCPGIVVVGAISLIAVFIVLYWVLMYSLSTSLLWVFLLSMVWLGIIMSSTWTEFYNFVTKALENVK